MPAPTINLNRGSVTYTMTPIEKDGFRISGSISQPALNADWTLTAWIQVADAAVVDDPDETATFNVSTKVPFNEAPNEAAVTAKLQGLVDHVFDNFVPTP
jgi:hypothetical protein